MTLLHRLLRSGGSAPFAVLAREGSDGIDVLAGDVVDVPRLADIPLDGASVLALVPFRQVVERGFAAHDDGAPLRCLVVRERERLDRGLVLDVLGDLEAPTGARGFDVPDEEYAASVRRVLEEEIGRGEGSNFVLRRTFRAVTSVAPATAALAWFRRLLAEERGAYWTFAVHAPAAGSETVTMVGATPERHVSVAGGVVRMNPISGTLRHPAGPPAREELLAFLADAKESEELFMVVDEEMKMMSAVCPDGGRILGPFLKPMSRLTHTEYVLEGRTSLDVREVLRATMFAPTVTGSPIGNACAVLARHERGARGYYAGVLALFEPEAHGGYGLDAPILIRTAYVHEDGRVGVPVGATLVRHSDPRSEVAETAAKAAGVLSALGLLPAAVPAARGAAAADAVPAGARAVPSEDVAAALARRNRALAPFWLEPQHARHAPPFAGREALVVDAGDQFTTMLAHQLRHLGMAARVLGWSEAAEAAEARGLVVLGPGPGDPRAHDDERIAVLHRLLAARLAATRPVVAVCLSHQLLALAAGLPVERLARPRQGVRMSVDVFGSAAAIGFYNTFAAIAPRGAVRTPRLDLEISAEPGSRIVSALRGPGIASVQGHLESVLSTDGLPTLERLVRWALDPVAREGREERAALVSGRNS